MSVTPSPLAIHENMTGALEFELLAAGRGAADGSPERYYSHLPMTGHRAPSCTHLYTQRRDLLHLRVSSVLARGGLGSAPLLAATNLAKPPAKGVLSALQAVPARNVQLYLLFGSRLVQSIMRMAMGPLLVYMCEDPSLGCDASTKGLLLSAFSLGYLMTQVAGGVLADKVGPKAGVPVATPHSPARRQHRATDEFGPRKCKVEHGRSDCDDAECP